MKQFFLKISGLAAMVLMMQAPVFAQEENAKKENPDKLGEYDQVIIKRKGDKDVKVTVEIKDGKVLVNGKPINEFDDENVSVHQKSIRVEDGEAFALISPAAPKSPFRGGFSYNGNAFDGYGDAKTAFLGVTSNRNDNGGAIVTEISKGSAAEKAGLKKGDIITKVDDKVIDDPEDLSETIRSHKPEEKVTVTYKRDGKELKVPAVLGKSKQFKFENSYNFAMPEMENDFDLKGDMAPRVYSWNSREPKIGIKAQDTEDDKGAKVLDVDDDSPAAKAGVKEGDIITQFDGKEVKNAETLSSLARAARLNASVKLTVSRDGKSQDIEIKTPRKLKTTNL
jgi:serine protease Do